MSSDVVVHLWPRARSGAGVRAAERVVDADAGSDGARWVSQLVRTVYPRAGTGDTCHEDAAVTRHPVWTAPTVDLGRLPVLLVGGLASTPASLGVLHAWLLRVNARPYLSPVRYGVDCGERTARQVAREVCRVADTEGRGVVLVAHSRGGQFARAVAVRHGDVVRGLVTLGTPINRLVGVRPSLQAKLVVLGALGTLGVPDLLSVNCLWGECCRRLRSDIEAPLPTGLTYLSVYSRQDEFVSWRSCLDPWARHRPVAASHSGMTRSPEVLQVLAQELSGHLGPRAGHAEQVQRVA